MQHRSVLFMGILFTLVFGFYWHATSRSIHHNVIEQKPIVVIIPSYNNEQWCDKNILSVLNQKYDNFRIVYIDDKSKDLTHQKIQKIIQSHPQGHRVQLIHNNERRGALYNLYHVIHACDDKEIIITVDGDDWLTYDHVLARINKEYADPSTWMTYGQFEFWPAKTVGFCKDFPATIIATNMYRKYRWIASHPRTFYAWLFKQVQKDDLLYNGEFFPMTWDQAFMYPMLEMAGTKAHCINEVLYSYNQANPINDGKVNLQLVLHLERFIRGKQRYSRLDKAYA